MRDFLEDAMRHMDAGAGRARPPRREDLPKRFYKMVATQERAEGWIVTLDGRQTRTPTRKPVALPSAALAEAVAAEWAAQGDVIDPGTMPHMRLVNSAVEAGPAARDALVAQILAFCGNDLLLYRADSPRELVALQDKHWDAVLAALARHFAVSFRPTVGIIHQDQPPAMLARLEESLRDTEHFVATALASMTGITGSGLLAIALRERLVDAETAWQAAHVDEDYQIAQWGEDFEASRRRALRRAEFDAAWAVMRWVEGG